MSENSGHPLPCCAVAAESGEHGWHHPQCAKRTGRAASARPEARISDGAPEKKTAFGGLFFWSFPMDESSGHPLSCCAVAAESGERS